MTRQGRPSKIENGVVTELEFLTDNVTDISPVRALSGLRSLKCSGSDCQGILTDISPLQGMQLTKLVLTGNPKLADISFLKGMPLTTFICYATAVSDLSALEGHAVDTT